MDLKKIIDEKFIDEIVEELARSEDLSKYRNNGELDKLKNRMDEIEIKLNKFMGNFNAVAVGVERQLTEKYKVINSENEQKIMNTQSQIENLRMAMIRLSNEIKKIRDALSPSV